MFRPRVIRLKEQNEKSPKEDSGPAAAIPTRGKTVDAQTALPTLDASEPSNALTGTSKKRSNQQHGPRTRISVSSVVASTSAKPKSKPFPHGNYDSYYSHRDPLSFSLPTTDLDPRLAKWNPAWFRGKRVLDIGCNSGIITCGLAARFDPELVLGLDIDPSLISKAQSFLALRYSYCSPLLALEEDSDGVKARKLAQKVEKTSYFPASAIASFGSLPLVRLDKIPLLEPDGTKRSLSGFPFNVRFAVSDFTSSLVSNDSAANPPSTAELTGSHSSSFDTILALAVTKWVHLNGGDPALLAFFRKVHGVLCPGGVFIMEAQPWSSYLKRVEPVELMQLKVRPEGFREMLEGMGFEMVERIGVDAGTDADDSGGEAAEDEGQRKKQKTAFADREMLVFRKI